MEKTHDMKKRHTEKQIVKQLKDMERQNSRLRKIIADQRIDIEILNEVIY